VRLIYIAGPFRGKSSWQIEQNVRRAEEASLKLWKAGAVPVCPHTMTRFFQHECDDDTFLKGTLELMTRCDAALFLKGWQESEGSKQEWELAKSLEMEIIYE
jgi:hypothetical protein